MDNTKFLINMKTDEEKYKLGVITKKFTGYANYEVQFDGETVPSKKMYGYLGNAVLSVGKRVILMKMSGTYVILGSIDGRVFN